MSSYLEDLIWMSYRYCIGRKTIAASMHAGNIAQNSYHDIPDDRKEFMAHDIRKEINDKLTWMENVSVSDYRHHIPEDALSSIIWKISYNYSETPPKNWNEKYWKYDVKDGVVSMTMNPDFDSEKKYYETISSKYDDLIPWIKLANALDKSTHRIVIIEYDGKIEEKTCFHFPIIDYNLTKIEEAWVGLDDYLLNPFICSCINPKYIKEIK